MMKTCLEDVRIVELARYQALPRGGLLLLDLGAEVIKVEPLEGEDLRHTGPFVHGESIQFAAYNRGKKSIAVDLRAKEGKALLADLLRCSDVLLENFKPGTMDIMGFPKDVLRRLNPTLIVCSVSGFGQYGPYRDWRSYDPIIQAMSGIAHQTGRPFGQPILAEGPIMDRLTAMHGAAGVLAALRWRDRTGMGQFIDVAMLDAGISYEEVALAMAHSTGTDEFLRGGTFIKCVDGWVITGSARGVMWKKLLELMGFHDLARDADFTAPMWTSPKSEERLELFRLWAEDKQINVVVETLQTNAVPCAPVRSIMDVLHDPHLKARGAMVEMPLDDEGKKTMLMPGMIIKMSETPTEIRGIPRLGEHNREIFGGVLGLGDAGMARLRQRKVIAET